MNGTERRGAAAVWFALVAAVFLAAVVYLIVVAALGENLANARDDVLLLVLALAGVLAVVGWWRDRSAVATSAGAEDRVREQLGSQLEEKDATLGRAREEAESRERERDDAVAARESLEAELRERDHALDHERDRSARMERARRAEKDWTRELRAQIVRMHRDRGSLADQSDVREMVLHLAMTLLEAEKGLLLSREDADHEDRLELVVSEGFEHDPRESAVAQRFASAVLEQDRTVREPDAGGVEADRRTPADEEIDNLVAIPIYISDEFGGVVVAANNPNGFEDFDDEVLLGLGDHAGAVLENSRLHGELRGSYLATVRMLAEAVEAKDPFLRGHSEEVSGYVAAVADQLGIEPGRREQLIFGSLLHDVGKIGISERILLKPAALTPQERSVIQLHPRIGYRLVDQVPALRPIAPALLYHHERFDGGGYPAGLRGDEIPLEARIIAVADSYSAMTSDRPYHMARSPEEACAELERGAGTQFDPEVVRLFVEEVRRGSADKAEVLAHALDDPELEVRRRGGEPILGHGALAVIDNLTLLYSRRHLQEAAHAEAERAGVQQRPFAVVLVELAELAELNAREGYAAGDAAIQSVAERLQHVAVRRGATACRYSGGRLALLAPATDEAAGEDLLGELEAELGEGPSVRTSLVVWQPGESGADTVTRARRGLEPEVAAAPSASPTSS